MVAGEVSARHRARERAAGAVAEAGQGGRPDEPVVYVGLVSRLIGVTIDALVIDAAALAVSGAVLLVFSVFSVAGSNHLLAIGLGGVAFFVWVVSYFGVFWTTTGQTVGSRVMQIRVTRTDGSRLRPRHALMRLAGMVISLPLFWGYLPVLTTSRRRGVPDMIAGTIVTRALPEPGVDLVADHVVSERRVVAVLAARDYDLRREPSDAAASAATQVPRAADGP
jgi:uncharacterized RDD family membrane protein YckC